MRINGEVVTITNKTIVATCNWYAKNALGCIREAANGDAPVNNLSAYTLEKLTDYDRFISGNFEPGLWFWQRAHYIQTGQSVPILS